MSEPSGPQWCSRFPGSAATADLTPDFRDRVEAFLSQLKHAGASVSISATYRPPERAYLMHWCWMIAREGVDPAGVPPMQGVAIAWLHKSSSSAPDIAASRSAAAQMVSTYDLRFEPSLTSRHTQRRAIDMTIGWSGTLTIRDFNAELRKIASLPRDGSNAELIDVGASFGVIKLVSDPPHWSDDGH
ncbi:MAG: peptidoglycan-binding domain-containing protein [Proteobacteria bacterium]|nr:peptidoglycan-binding domain-containing protein [Pseudomonadota bacterium]